MRARIVIARLIGVLYLLLGGSSLFVLLDAQIREHVTSLSAVIFRYGGFVVVGVGLLLLKKWSAYVLAFVLVANFVLIYTIYDGQTADLDGFMAVLPWVGPLLIAALFVYLWPVLQPQVQALATSPEDATQDDSG